MNEDVDVDVEQTKKQTRCKNYRSNYKQLQNKQKQTTAHFQIIEGHKKFLDTLTP